MDNEAQKSAAIFGNEYVESWKKNRVKTPSDFRTGIDDRQYYLDWCNYVYALYCNNYCLITPGGYIPSVSQVSLSELRLYGRGQQPVEKYKNRIDVSNIKGPSGSKVGLVNISWRTHRVYQKIREIIIDRLMSVEHEPGVVALDLPALRKKEIAYASDLLATTEQSKAMFEQVGMLPEGVNEDIMSMSKTDVEILNQMGGYKTAAELAFQEAALACLQFSNFDPEIRRQIIEDLVDAGHMATWRRYDKPSGQMVVEYVDLNGLIAPRSDYDDCRDIHYAGMVKNRSVSWLRQYSGLSEDELLDIIKRYKNTGMNGQFGIDYNNLNAASRGNYTQRYSGYYPYDQFEVQVMSLYFIGLDVERFIVGHRPEGNMIYSRVAPDARLNRRDEKKGKEVEDNVVQYVYKVNWIVGTNYIFDFGIDDVVVRDGAPGAMRAKLPLSIYRCNKGSITDACIGAIDDLQLALYKKRHAITVTPPPPNMAVDTSLMQDSVRLGDLSLSPVEVAEIYSVLGFYFYASKSEFSGMGEGSNRPPLTPLSDSTGQYLATLGGEILTAIQSLREISGVNELVDGTGNPKDVLNGVAQGAETASNRSISGLYTAVTSHYKSMVSSIIKGYQCLSRYGELKMNYLPVGSEVVRILNMYPEYGMHELDISVVPGMDNNSRQQTFAALTSNRQEQKIDEATFLNVMTLLQQGNVRRAQFVMAKAVEDMEAKRQKDQIEVIKAQSAAQGEQAQVTEKAKQATVQLEGQLKIQQIVAQGEQDRETERLKMGLMLTQSAVEGPEEMSEMTT